MYVPSDGWLNGSWNPKRPQFRLLAEMLGVTKTSISPEDLQALFRLVASEKVFGENVEAFLNASGQPKKTAAQRLEEIEKNLGLMDPVPFMSLKGICPPSDFDGVAIWPGGVVNWMKLRLEQIRTAEEAGAHFRRIVCLNSSRKCNSAADKRHPLLRGAPDGEEPTEKGLQHMLVAAGATDPSIFAFADLPDLNQDGRMLSLEQQLIHLRESGQYDELIGGRDIYVPSTPNSLYVPLHVRRVLGHDDVWFSQAGARLVRAMPDSWWPSLQAVMTTPNGIIRLWVELLHAGCMTP